MQPPEFEKSVSPARCRLILGYQIPRPHMETRRRSLLKAFSWQVLGFVLSLAITWHFTGELQKGATLSGWLAATGMVMYTLHERCWNLVHWGLIPSTRGYDPKLVDVPADIGSDSTGSVS